MSISDDIAAAMFNNTFDGSRIVSATHGVRAAEPDASYELELSAELKRRFASPALQEIYQRHSTTDGFIDTILRRAAIRALLLDLGAGLSLACFVRFKHPETMSIGSGVLIGEHTLLQGRFDGRCTIGNGTWIGPQVFMDARDLVIEAHVGIGPGVKILGSEHTGEPVDRPIIRTDLVISPVRIGAWADIGTNATILPGVTLGKGCIVGAGAVVTCSVPPFAKVAGVPAKIIGWRGQPQDDGS